MPLEAKVKAWLNDGKALTASWDAGGDEMLVDVLLDGTRLDWDDLLAVGEAIGWALNLPSAGEYFVKGAGTIFLEDGVVMIEHSSEESGWGWDPITNDEVELEASQVSAKVALFTD